MKFIETALPDVFLVEAEVVIDPRGFLMETWRDQAFRQATGAGAFVQENHSRSTRGVLRGLHFQRQHPQGKLVRVVAGDIFDVAVDLRPGSAHLGRWFGRILSGEDHLQLYVPPGFAHGFLVLSERADVIYKCTDYYHPEDQAGIRWNDPDIAIDWPAADVVLSARDAVLPWFRDACVSERG